MVPFSHVAGLVVAGVAFLAQYATASGQAADCNALTLPSALSTNQVALETLKSDLAIYSLALEEGLAFYTDISTCEKTCEYLSATDTSFTNFNADTKISSIEKFAEILSKKEPFCYSIKKFSTSPWMDVELKWNKKC